MLPLELTRGINNSRIILEEFIKPKISWAHFDLMAWNLFSKPGRPRGGEAMGNESCV